MLTQQISFDPNMLLKLILCSILVFGTIKADTPANCTYDDILGTWLISESERGASSSENCSSNFGSIARKFRVELLESGYVNDENGQMGFWTVVYNQGFEIVINHRKYFAFSYYTKKGPKVSSFCNVTFPGWSHDVLGKNWACYKATKVGNSEPKISIELRVDAKDSKLDFEKYISKVENKTWQTTIYNDFANKNIDELLKLAGGHLSKVKSTPKPKSISRQHLLLQQSFPESFDWRNVNGINYVSPIRNQGACGSCYSFASMAMLESRIRIATNNKVRPVLSPQDVVSCSKYAQGCEGGFPYLIAGKYAQDYGVIPESCFPYTGQDSKCNEKKCTRFYTSDYKYVGGYFGGCNEVLMRAAIIKNGPIAIGFEVTPEFMAYRGGIFQGNSLLQHTAFEETNHAVLIVGYGVDKKSGLKYWSVKNSWGESWGEEGYFRIRRGHDDLHIESMAVESTPIPF